MKTMFALVLAVFFLSGCTKDAHKDEFQGFRLGERYSDILYRKGFPTGGSEGISLNYAHDDLAFKDGVLFLIDHTCQKDDSTSLANIRCGTPDRVVKEKLGSEFLYLCKPTDEFSRVIAFPKQGIYFMLQEAKVSRIGLTKFTVPYDPQFNYRGYMPNDPRWIPCT